MTSEASSALAEFKRQQQEKEQTSAFEAIDPRKKQLDTSSPNYILDHYKELYASIQRFREEDVANEAEAVERKKNLGPGVCRRASRNYEQRLGPACHPSGLALSHDSGCDRQGRRYCAGHNRRYSRRPSCFAGPPGPPWSFAIAGATAAMTAVNVAKIAGVGFQVWRLHWGRLRRRHCRTSPQAGICV
jgi:hypothetical protein